MNMQEHALMEMRPGAVAVPQHASGVDFLRVLRRHQGRLVVTFLVVIGLAALALAFIEPRYQATAVMRVDVEESALRGEEETAASIRDAELRREHQIETQIQLLQSRPVARQVVRDLALHDDPEFNPDSDPDKKTGWDRFFDRLRFWDRGGVTATPSATGVVSPQLVERTTDRLLEMLDVAQDGQSSFIDVTVTSRNPEKAAVIANKVTRVYVKTQVEERQAAIRRRIQTLGERVAELRGQLVSTEQTIAAYRRSRGLDAGAGSQASAAQMGRAAAELAAVRGQRAETEQRSGSAGQIMSPLLADLRSQQTTTQRRLGELSTLYGNAHPDVRKARAELDQLAGSIAQEAGRVRAQLANEASAQRSREAQLAGDLSSLRARSLADIVEGVPLADLERNATATQTVYLALLGRLTEISRNERNVKADAAIASPALQPTQPSFPRRTQIMAAAAAAAVIFGMIIVMLSEALDTQVRSAAQVWAIAGLATLGMVPELKKARRRIPTHLRVIGQPYTIFAEAIRSIETRLGRNAPRTTGNIVLVTSPLPDEGKTSISIGLAAAAVARGRRAVVVDFDLRRPGLASLLDDASGGKDLLDYIRGEAEIDEIILPSGSNPAVHGVMAHRPAPDPGAAIASPRVDALFAILRARYDLIVVNTPPVLAVSDAQQLARFAEQSILVLRWGRTTPDLLRSAILQFGETLTGVVFNRVRYGKHARFYYGDGIQQYHRYARDAQPALLRLPILRLLGRRSEPA
ncbi:polysaccharide biosynthesis tyrosine autokinase [Sphingomonas sp. BT-65]|uniref:GumC family protein n=1 Tax=Sphingomonas sp. BT-65 TaxID=2989821 RepID=UPI00223595CA|nr:polysaccharide biosynthesis tyrosine autokinase [Sphingomonas sp. BT-65]MCW4463453.1 polysaccharide biosynthesis tyrosine autokinase [Sphingomonas sp. BT-65]